MHKKWYREVVKGGEEAMRGEEREGKKMHCPHCPSELPERMMGELVDGLPSVCPGICGSCANYFILINGEAVPLKDQWRVALEHSPVWPVLQALRKKALIQIARKKAELN